MIPFPKCRLPKLRFPKPSPVDRAIRRSVGVLALCGLLAAGPALATPACTAAQPAPLVPTDPALCASLADAVRKPGDLPLDQYEAKLGDYLRNFCHRDEKAGWTRDKRVRDTGPYTASLQDGQWVGTYAGTHAPVVIWYSPDMVEWLKVNRPSDEAATPVVAAPVPDGAIMVKEMFPAPAAACAGVDPLKLLPTSGAAVMVRDAKASHDGWFWGWFGWSGWAPDYPPGPTNPLPNMGFGQYCLNCHASAKSEHTFASLKNMLGQPGQPLVFLSQDFFDAPSPEIHHRLVALPTDDAKRLGQPQYGYDTDVTTGLKVAGLPKPTWETVSKMPSETYDNVWVKAGGPNVASEFVTSDQCLGCHDAGSTGLQFDMTKPNPHGAKLLNLSPYATWWTSPMGLAGRDPIFFAQLASETQTFHPESSELVQNTCLGCHGILGQRQFSIDTFKETGKCQNFLRTFADAVPFPAGNPTAGHATYGALARDGVSCTSCHRMALGAEATAQFKDAPQNACIDERQAFLNPDATGFAKTFTGSFLVGPPDKIYGPFKDPKVKPMEQALGNTPEYHAAIKNSETCGTCHTVHLPVLDKGAVIGHVYEQTTYPEWAFSAYRTGEGVDGKLPGGAGSLAASCQDCHMPSRDANGKPYRSKIASIQEYSNFPQAENNLGPEDIDLPVRDGFAQHTLVGLNVFFTKMAQQFPDILGIRTQDPMLVSKGVDPLIRTEQAMLDQASAGTAAIAVTGVKTEGGTLNATVAVTSKTGHKLPSGVGFRRAFIEFDVLDANGAVLWASGRTNGAGVIVDAAGKPVAGELWWKDDCSGRTDGGKLAHQPHFQVVSRQDQAQIYQELVTAPPAGVTPTKTASAAKAAPVCGEGVKPTGEFTTSFLSICGDVKDNRILPHGFLKLEERLKISEALGAGKDLAEDVGSTAVGDDPDYVDGGGDSLVYAVPLADIKGTPASVQATLYYQAIPPYYLQDRFCTAKGADTERLYFLAGHLNLDGTEAADWKLKLVGTGAVSVTGTSAAAVVK
ncbi:hypothetical protein N825_00190 [Skermanella stibiiresistens SB22]|uniref:Cytochrome P460 domain-containing protein n=1 Tax=Skermanella stibiiresistens SB22 TaxID=1385369 RepID=W9H8M6_9PROT|nr:cytochrome P460 family protein [Skermanella stibiiresistens]EWY42404.1 hypothetical protein N825_00190 [Skermanella stibiiresistens SB22]